MRPRHSFVVLQSFPPPRSTTNPYVVMLADALRALPTVELRYFSWKTALLTHYDVFHAHWPEILVTGRSPVRKLVRQSLFVLLLVKLRFSRTPAVRTLHNLHLPDGISAVEKWLLTALERQTSLFIVLNQHTPVPAGKLHAFIPHGHYRGWYGSRVRSDAVPGRIGYFGLIRRYKNVRNLVDTFREMPDSLSDTTLLVAGNPSTAELAAELVAAADPDGRVQLRLHFLDDQELVTVATESTLVVLPYREMHNSGGALTALSLDRPVLVPDNAVNRDLRDEVGAEWVLLYDGELDAADLDRALTSAARGRVNKRADLSRREWDSAGRDHLLAYHRAVEQRRRRTSRRVLSGSVS